MKALLPPLLALLPLTRVWAQDIPAGPIPESRQSQIGYKSVADALNALKAQPDVTIRTDNNWTIFIDERNFTIWSFAPTSHPAYPSVIKRQVTPRLGGGSEITMNVLCEASKPACDQLVRDFAALNNRLPH